MSKTQLFSDLSPEEVRDVKAFVEYRRALDKCGYRPVVGASRGSKTKLLKSGDLSVATFVDEVIAHDGLAATVVPDLRTKAKLRGLKARENMLNYQGSPWKSDLVADYLGITVQMVSRKRRCNQLLGVSFGKKEYLYPSWQFDRLGILKGMELVLSALKEQLVPDWDKLCFFVSDDERLGGDSPVVALQTGRIDEVLAVAKVYGRQLS